MSMSDMFQIYADLAARRDALLTQEYINVDELERLANEAERKGFVSIAANLQARVNYYRNRFGNQTLNVKDL